MKPPNELGVSQRKKEGVENQVESRPEPEARARAALLQSGSWDRKQGRKVDEPETDEAEGSGLRVGEEQTSLKKGF